MEDRIIILLFILVFTLLFINNKTEHLTSESNEALQTLSSLYTNQGTLVVPNLKVTGNITAANLTLTGSNVGSCGAKNTCLSVAPEYHGNYGLNVSGNIQTENIISANYGNIGSGIVVENTGYIGKYANGSGAVGAFDIDTVNATSLNSVGNIVAGGNISSSGNATVGGNVWVNGGVLASTIGAISCSGPPSGPWGGANYFCGNGGQNI